MSLGMKVLKNNIVKPRKDKQCAFCNKTIKKGESAYYCVAVDDGEFHYGCFHIKCT